MNSAEYKCWQENCTFLYDYISSYMLDPLSSLTSCWLQNDEEDKDYYYIAVGVRDKITTECAIRIYKTLLENNLEIDHRKLMHFDKSFGYNNYTTLINTYSLGKNEVNRVRSSPLNRAKLASVLSEGEVKIFDVSDPKHVKIELVLGGHSECAWGLSWSKFNYELVTSSDDGTICLWDINNKHPYETKSEHPICTPLRKFSYSPKNTIQTVEASYDHPAIFFSGDDESNLLCWDCRINDCNNFGFPIYDRSQLWRFNSISQNIYRSWFLATGSDSNDVILWDIRRCGAPIAKLQHHKDVINCIEFSPHVDNLLASTSHDNCVKIWDLNSIGDEQTLEASFDGPPELLFTHKAHLGPVQDINWHYEEEKNSFITSVCDKGVWCMWKPDDSLLFSADSDDEDTIDSNDEIFAKFPLE